MRKIRTCKRCGDAIPRCKPSNAKYCSNHCATTVPYRDRKPMFDARHTFIENFKRLTGCADCGIPLANRKLHFHHLDPASKSFNVSKALTVSLLLLFEEIGKCVLLCDDCHKRRHREMRKKSKPAS